MKSPLERIPGVGKALSRDLERMGFREVAELANQDPEALYEQIMAIEGQHVDRCVLYVFRCALYFASHTEHEPEKLKWWNWSDARLAAPKTP